MDGSADRGRRGAADALLGLGDHRPAYDVTTPERVWAYWNVMTLGRPAGEVLAAFAALCRRAVAQVLSILSDQARGAVEPAGGGAVLTFEGLRREVERNQGEAARVAELARSVAARGLDLPEQCRLITERCWAASGRSGRRSSWASPHALSADWAAGRRGRRLRPPRGRRGASGNGTGPDRLPRPLPRHLRHELPGPGRRRVAARHAAPYAARACWIDWPAETPAALDVPAVNIGPWSRDFHSPLERLHTPYAFGVLPELLLETVREILRPKGFRRTRGWWGEDIAPKVDGTASKLEAAEVVGRGHLAAAARRGQRGVAVARRLRVLPRLGQHLLEALGHAAARARPEAGVALTGAAGRVVAGSGLKRRRAPRAGGAG